MTSLRGIMAALPLAVALAACQGIPTGTPGETPEFIAHAQQMQSIHGWEVEGRIGFRYEGDGGTGAMSWRQDFEHISFSFRGPLGAGSFRVTGTPPDLLLETGDGETLMLTDPDTELRARFGWSAPFESLRYWMVGVPRPDAASSVSVDEDGLLRELRQDGWVVTYDRYHDAAPPLPRKLTIVRDGVRIRVIVDRWSTTDTDSPTLTGHDR